ncbi:hypothetical protein BKA59DRAFT_476161 [Fusarium tricinctum]|uniref:CFEM domain-containing protein n=1 Tax=Fusarium tricinctum TaxID=61284 RepID=A0A8K0RXH2_9HYPO|nr:hypothetical protein BKA59DRAFT_476161 [Fusarium tricinctum]
MMLIRGVILACIAALPLALAESSSASSLSALPACAQQCFKTAIASSTCEPTDSKCLCTNAALQHDIEVCVGMSCTVREALGTKNATMTSCNVPIRSHRTEFVVLNDVMGIVTGIFVFQRFATKLFWKLPLGLDDLFILVAMCFAIPSITINSYGLAPNGMGRDLWTLTASQITHFGMFFFVMAILYFALQTTLKLSMLFFYLRIFPTRGVRRLLWGTVAFTVLFGLVFVFVAIFQCKPINYFWTKWDGEHAGTCADVNAITVSSAAINIALDIWIMGIPLSQLKQMNLDWRKKIGVGMMFSVGVFVTIMSILRLSAVVQAGAGHSINVTWDYVVISKWSTIEANVGIVCACMPSLRILLVRLFPKLLGTSQRYYNYGSNKPTGGNTNKSRTQPLGTNATSQVDRSKRQRIDPAGIQIDRSYEVEYGETDETYLVHMKDLDHKSANSEVRSEVSL